MFHAPMNRASILSLLIAVGGTVACATEPEETSEATGDLAITKSCLSPNGASHGTLCGACNGNANGPTEFSVGDLYTCTQDDPHHPDSGTCTLKTQCGFGCQAQGRNDNGQWADICLPSPGIFSLAATSVKGGNSVQAKATFATPHPSSQFWTSSDTDSDNIQVVLDSPLVNVAPTETNYSFTIKTKPVKTIHHIHVTGFFGNEEQAILLTVNP